MAAADLSRVFVEWHEWCEGELHDGFEIGRWLEGVAAECEQTLARTGFPYMDLAGLWLNYRLAVVQRVVKGDLSKEESLQQMSELSLRIGSEIRHREAAAGQAEREKLGLILQGLAELRRGEEAEQRMLEAEQLRRGLERDRVEREEYRRRGITCWQFGNVIRCN